MTGSLKRELDFAAEVARHAGGITLGYFQSGVEADLKEDESPVTIADREAEQEIRRLIGQAYPDDGILGEEFGRQEGSSGRVWIVDPIDGTKTFVQGVPLYGVLIGLDSAEGVLAGAAYLPALDEMVCAARGEGCWWNGQRSQVSPVSSLSAACACYTSERSFDAQNRGDIRDRVAAATRLWRGWGDCYGHILVATGRAEAMFDPVMNPWDCAPFEVIMAEAGGTFTDWGGEPTIHGADAVSTNGHVYEEVMSFIGS